MKLIISDLDGTILKQGEKSLPNELFDLILELKKKGIVFAVASGRPYIELKKFFSPVLHDIYFICENGAVILYQGKVIKKNPLSIRKYDRDVVRSFSDELGPMALAGTHTIYTIQNHPEVSEYYRGKKLSIMKIPSLSALPEECVRLSLFRQNSTKTLEQCILLIRNVIGGEINIIYQDDKWIDIVANDVNKGNAIRFLQNLWGINKEETLVFGDNVNDNELFQTSNYSYAMEWAIDSVKKNAKYSTDCVIKTIKEYI